MKDSNEDFDNLLNKLITSTRSPRGRFTAKNSWKILADKLLTRKRRRIFWLRMTSSAAVVLLCVASWAAYHVLHLEPTQPQPITTIHSTSPQPERRREILYFQQQPLQEVTRQLAEIFQKKIVIDDDSLRNYRMTGTFDTKEELTKILDLLKKAAGNFDYTQTNDTITITKQN